jgi:hypothetical protein
MRTIQDVVARIRAEYLGVPGTRLDLQQVQRLCGVARILCKTVLDSLVDAKFLCLYPTKADLGTAERVVLAS